MNQKQRAKKSVDKAKAAKKTSLKRTKAAKSKKAAPKRVLREAKQEDVKSPEEAEVVKKSVEDEESTVREEANVSQAAFESDIETSFFYTSDKFINSIDNQYILDVIKKKYPQIYVQNTDCIIKKGILGFLNDEDFVAYVLKFFGMTLLELMNVMFKQYGSLFKGPYLKKVRKALSGKKYAK